MSRAYKISVSESVSKVIRAEDHVSTQLEMLDILPCDQMADLLAEELVKAGFERKGDTVQRTDDGTKIVVELKTGTVTVTSADAQAVTVKGEKTGRGYDDQGPSAKQVRKDLTKGLVKELEQDLSDKEQNLQRQVTDKLESQLSDLKKELDQAVNRATAEALKQKAAQLGQIKELTEDPESGSMTIVVEV